MMGFFNKTNPEEIYVVIGKFLVLLLIITGVPSLTFPGTTQDFYGNRITVPDEKARVVSLVPGVTEVLYAIGLRDEIVGVSDFCNYPPDFVAEKPKMGGFSAPNIERIQSVSPHVVVVTTAIPLQVARQFERLGIQYYVAQPNSFSELLHMIESFGRLFNREREAHNLVQNMKEESGKILQALRMKSLRPVKTFIEIWYNPIYASGKNTLPGDVVRLAGGEVVPDTVSEYPLLSEEKVLELNPEAIILGYPVDLETFYNTHRQISGIYAIRSRKVFIPDLDEFLRPGPRIVHAMEDIARFLHPEAF